MKLNELLKIEHPIILAPMFLVSNVAMVKAALDTGITAAIPAFNYRTSNQLAEAIAEIKKHSIKPFGINLVVNRSNIYLKRQLQTCIDHKVDYIITALGSPKSIINVCRKHGIKVFCDIINVDQAKKVENLGVDAVIAVNNKAGGHLGFRSPEDLIPKLSQALNIPVISAGGVGNYEQMKEVIKLGASGCSIGSMFIASEEATVSDEYKNAIVRHGSKDIVITKKLSGTPCAVINTSYLKSIGLKENSIEKLMHRHHLLKKYIKLIISLRGMKSLRKAAYSSTYKKVWAAGHSIEEVKEILPISKIIEKLTSKSS